MAEAACQTHGGGRLMGCRHCEHSELFRQNEWSLTKEKVDTRGERHFCKRKKKPPSLLNNVMAMLISAFKRLRQAIFSGSRLRYECLGFGDPSGGTMLLHNTCARMFETGALSCDVT